MQSDYDQESKLKLQEWDKLIANKKSLMTIIIIFKQCDETTRTKIALNASYEDNFEAEELLKFLARVDTVCNISNNGDLLFGSRVAKIIEPNFRPIRSVEELLAVHTFDDPILDHTDPCNVSIDTVDNAEIITSSHIMEELIYACHKFDSQELLPVTVSMSHDDDESWFDVHKDFDSWHDTSETMDN